MTAELFDPTPYGPGTPPRRTAAPTKPAQPNATNDGTWLVIRRRGGPPHPGLHRRKADGRHGAVITHCGLQGGALTVADLYPHGQPIVACPKCLAVT